MNPDTVRNHLQTIPQKDGPPKPTLRFPPKRNKSCVCVDIVATSLLLLHETCMFQSVTKHFGELDFDQSRLQIRNAWPGPTLPGPALPGPALFACAHQRSIGPHRGLQRCGELGALHGHRAATPAPPAGNEERDLMSAGATSSELVG